MEYNKLPAEMADTAPEYAIPHEFPKVAQTPKKKKAKHSSVLMAMVAGVLTVSLYFDSIIPFDLSSPVVEPDAPSEPITQPTDPTAPSDDPTAPPTDPTTPSDDPTVPPTDPSDDGTVIIDRVTADGVLLDWRITNVYDESAFLTNGIEMRVLYAYSGCSLTSLRDFEPFEYPASPSYCGAYRDNGDGTFAYDYALMEPYSVWQTYTADDTTYRKAGGGYFSLPDGAWYIGDVAYSQGFFVIIGDPGTVPDLAPLFTSDINWNDTFYSAINLMRWWAPYGGVQLGGSFGDDVILDFTAFNMCIDEYGENLYVDGDYSYYTSYLIPAEVFEAAAADYFAVVDIQALRSQTGWFYDYGTDTGIDYYQYYQEDLHAYRFGTQGGWGDSSHYDILGYVANEDGTYTIYACYVDIYETDAPEGTLGIDYLISDGTYWKIYHFLETTVAFSGGRVQFHSWQQLDARPEVELIEPLLLLGSNQDVQVHAPSGVFPADATAQIAMGDMKTEIYVSSKLSSLTDTFVAYDITANAQQNGLALVSISIPNHFDRDNLAVYLITTAGQPQRLAVQISGDTITAETDTLGLIVLVQLNAQ